MNIPVNTTRKHQILFTLWVVFFLLFLNLPLQAATIQIAVASNFATPLKALARQFEQHTSHKVTIITASSGKLYAQIMHGAPYDAFFSADSQRPQLLENHNKTITNSRFTYALGTLVLWSNDPKLINNNYDILRQQTVQPVAMANPRLAPYGRAALEVLQKLDLLETLKPHLIRGENIGQTFHFVKSANAPLGFVALSQVQSPAHQIPGSFWLIPDNYYSPIEQQAVQLKNNPATKAFMAFVRSEPALLLIQSYGYKLAHAQ